MTTTAALVRGMRPRQWVKNLLVLAAPLAAGTLLERSVIGPTLLAFLCFCLASGAVYLINDCLDRDSDRLHPRKRLRPVASGELTRVSASVCAGALATVSLVVAWLTSRDFAVLLAAYLVIQLAYALWLKHEPVIDLVIVASGFLLRALAGGVAVGLPISQWFLLVSGFGSLFIVAGKRFSEIRSLGSDAGTRRSLIRYTESYLRFVWSLAASATVLSYSLWAFAENVPGGVPWHTISIAPFIVGVLRYAVDIDAAKAAEPEDIVWGDRVLQVVGLSWLVVVCLGVLRA
ncbi:decaprenyl-phosphate phosphoribosyltransferase [Nocardioides jensenii]|uniref:decaprenyl-phosphate phosphoribosyltransferase n=1 Tax=Nocardioides jensenii TaxID=1843 RepID=UPI001FE018F6|nr:decaprenyl-phosphate phosphoribosyltransferase [Nocardioides jensenii]